MVNGKVILMLDHVTSDSPDIAVIGILISTDKEKDPTQKLTSSWLSGRILQDYYLIDSVER